MGPGMKTWHECRPHTHMAAGGEGDSANSDPSQPVPCLKGSCVPGVADRGDSGYPMKFNGLLIPHPISQMSYQRSR